MQESLWSTLLRRIPPAKHDILIVVTAAGVELMIKKIIRLDEDFVILRGRLAGSSDQNRIVILPYTQIDNVAFGVMLPEAEIQAIFGERKNAARATGAATAAATPEPTATTEEPAAESEAVAASEPAAEAEPVADASDVSTESPTPRADDDPSAPKPASLPAIATKPSKSVLLARLRARLGAQPSRAP